MGLPARALPDGRTRFLNREHESSWLRQLAPRRSGVLGSIGGLVDYVFGEPLHLAIVRRMMLGIKRRAEEADLGLTRDGLVAVTKG